MSEANKTILLDSENADAYETRGLALHELGKYEQAVDCLTKAISLDP